RSRGIGGPGPGIRRAAAAPRSLPGVRCRRPSALFVSPSLRVSEQALDVRGELWLRELVGPHLREIQDPARVGERHGRAPADQVEAADGAVAIVANGDPPTPLLDYPAHVSRIVADVDREEVDATTVARGDPV